MREQLADEIEAILNSKNHSAATDFSVNIDQGHQTSEQLPPDNLEDRLMSLYTAKVEVIAAKYQVGGFDYLKEHKPALYNEIQQAEDKLNEVWESALENKSTVAEFETAVNQWYELQLKAIQSHQNHMDKLFGLTSTDLNQVIKEAIQKERALIIQDSERSKVTELETLIINALQGRPLPIRLSPCEQMLMSDN